MMNFDIFRAMRAIDFSPQHSHFLIVDEDALRQGAIGQRVGSIMADLSSFRRAVTPPARCDARRR
jgi:hypothetical protein